MQPEQFEESRRSPVAFGGLKYDGFGVKPASEVDANQPRIVADVASQDMLDHLHMVAGEMFCEPARFAKFRAVFDP
ncbi:hypothetical protein [Candidatus Binatus sp.]|uniref:hypothetical protein n=1 Tax=Candidatus Binatus sp. TaxID=2811406 RepID=UPI003C35B405